MARSKPSLATYQHKRDFEKTNEPAGSRTVAARSKRRTSEPRFVVQEHSATSMHWDLRLEHEGVLMSWAVPKGIPFDPKESRLAIRTEDHPLEYLDFEGDIPAGSYGAGHMGVWDHGTYELEELEDGKVHVAFHGERTNGRYVLVRTKEGGGEPQVAAGAPRDQWILRRLDPPQDPDALPLPEHVQPMLAKLGDLPSDQSGWAFEVKWDGIRAIAFVEGGRVRLETRNLNDVTRQYPDLARLGRALHAHTAVLDGEIVAFDAQGRPSFQTLQSRLGLSSDSTIRTRSKATPAHYMAFDLLYLDGRDLRGLPYEERRRTLVELLPKGERWDVPAHHVGEGDTLLAAVVEQGLEGVVAKRLDSSYREGSRGSEWTKIKRQQRQEFVVCGWTAGNGRRSGGIGALLLGYYDTSSEEAAERGVEQRLVHAGSVGTGFSDRLLAQIEEQLRPLELDRSPYDEGGPGTTRQLGKWQAMRAKDREREQEAAPELDLSVRFAEPRLVCEVEYTEFTRDGTLRHPSFKGLREDKDARDVVREDLRDAGETAAKPKRTASTRRKGGSK